MGIWDKIKQSFGKNVVQSKFYSNLSSNRRLQSRPLTTVLNENKQQKVMAVAGLTGAGAATKAGNIAKSIWQGVKTFTTKKTINPAAGVKGTGNIVKTLAKTAGAGALVGTIFQGGRLISKAGVSGESPTAKQITSSLTKGAITGGGIGLSPAGGLIGAFEGGGVAVGKEAQNFYNMLVGKGQSMLPDNWKPSTDKFKDITQDLPSVNMTPNITYNFTSPNLPATPTNVFLEQPSMPQVQTTPLFSPSISLGGMGGGLSESLPLLLLLGAGVGGYALGRKRKRKKKKYKKKRKHK